MGSGVSNRTSGEGDVCHGGASSDMLPTPANGLKVRALPGGAVVLAFYLHPARTRERSPLLAKLPPAQLKIVELALEGLSDRAIAEALGRSRHTISNQLRRAYQRLGVNSRAELSALLRA